MIQETLRQYQDLLKRVDEKSTEISSAYAGDLACKRGCHSCCKPGLTVSLIEAESIRAFLRENPERAETAKSIETANPHKNTRCSFLAADGACSIYEARPLVCRSHGLPLQYSDPDSDSKLRDVCPLNFKNGIGSLPAEKVLNLDTINMLLALLNKRAFGKKSERIPLQPSALA